VAQQHSYLLPRLYAPQLDCIVFAAGSQILAVWRECDGEDRLTVASQRIYLLLRFYTPELDCFVLAAGGS
jgi:hypothetical protein